MILSAFKRFWLIYLAGYVTLASVAAFLLPLLEPDEWLPSIILLLLYGLFFGASSLLFDNPKKLYIHLYFLAQTIVLLTLISLHQADTFHIGILFLPITSQAPLLLPFVPGFLWVAAFFGLEIIGALQLGGVKMLSETWLSIGGYAGFGGFGALLRQSEQRRQESQMLLLELQDAHAQLQQYTKQAEQLAVSEERNRLAREMHDALGHRLTVAVVQLEGAKRLIPTEPDRAATIVDSMRTQLKEALAELRQTISSLRSPTEPENEVVDLETAVITLVQTFQTATALPVHLVLDPLPPLPSAHHKALFRAVQESLTNVQRHAQAHTAWVTIKKQNGRITLTTRDDGQGFSGEIEDGRFGLRGLEERATELGGNMSIQALETKGTALTFSIPLPEAVHDA